MTTEADTFNRVFSKVEFGVHWCANSHCTNGHEGDAAVVAVNGYWCVPCLDAQEGEDERLVYLPEAE